MLAVLGLAIASVSINGRRTFSVHDSAGAPVAGAFVAYRYEGTTYQMVEAVTYSASRLSLLQSDAAGRVVVPWAIHAHWPVVQSRTDVNVDLIYAPALHNGLASISRRTAVSRPHQFEVSSDLADVRLEDVSGDPILWQGTLENLSGLLGRLTSLSTSAATTPGLVDELVGYFVREYSSMLQRYGDAPRPLPPLPESVRTGSDRDRREWQAMVDKDLSQRPRWGDELQRRFATEVRLYASRRTSQR
jgi:hypothetical protein